MPDFHQLRQETLYYRQQQHHSCVVDALLTIKHLWYRSNMGCMANCTYCPALYLSCIHISSPPQYVEILYSPNHVLTLCHRWFMNKKIIGHRMIVFKPEIRSACSNNCQSKNEISVSVGENCRVENTIWDSLWSTGSWGMPCTPKRIPGSDYGNCVTRTIILSGCQRPGYIVKRSLL